MSTIIDANIIKKSNFAAVVRRKTANGLTDTYLIAVTEGSGDNIDADDIADGIVDYMNDTLYAIEDGISINETDGGMVLFREAYCDKNAEELIMTAVTDLLGNTKSNEDYIITCLPATIDADFVEDAMYMKDDYIHGIDPNNDYRVLLDAINNATTH